MASVRRVVILGPGASGKSTLAVRLGQITGPPVIELDQRFWRPGWPRPLRPSGPPGSARLPGRRRGSWTATLGPTTSSTSGWTRRIRSSPWTSAPGSWSKVAVITTTSDHKHVRLILITGGGSARKVNDAYQVSAVNLCSVTPPVNRPLHGPVSRASGQHHGDLRRALEEAALALISERGPRGFTLAEASRRAGVSVAAPYKHYADRDALLAALALRGYREQQRRFAAAVAAAAVAAAGAAGPAGQLAAFAVAYVTFAAEERSLFAITFAAGLDKASYPELVEAANDVLAVLTAPARQLSEDPEGARELVLAVAASAHGLAVFLLEGVFGPLPEALPPTLRRAAAAARTLARHPAGQETEKDLT